MKRLTPLVALVSILAGASACSPCPSVTRMDASTADPAMVQVLFSVECGGEPQPGLTAENITLFEGGVEVSSSEAQWAVDPHSAVLETYTLLLIDVSDSIIRAGTLETAGDVAVEFAGTLIAQNQQVSVAVFDGDTEVRPVIGFSNNLDLLTDAIRSIGSDTQVDESTNLNGAVLQGLEILDQQVAADVAGELMSVGNLVVFTDGVDRANRESDSSARSAVRGSDHQVFVVGLVGEEAVADLEALAPDGFFQAEDSGALLETFDDLAERLIDEVNKFYRVTYCSPLRKPRTRLKIDVSYEGKKDSISFEYPTSDFGPGCEIGSP